VVRKSEKSSWNTFFLLDTFFLLRDKSGGWAVIVGQMTVIVGDFRRRIRCSGSD